MSLTPSFTHSPLLKSADYLLAFAAGFLAFALYLRTLAPGLLGGDSGEFQFAAWLGGFVHPTGYPLYLILGYLWTHLLPLGDPAWRMNAFSALWGGVAVGLVYLLVLRMLQSLFRADVHAARGAAAPADEDQPVALGPVSDRARPGTRWLGRETGHSRPGGKAIFRTVAFLAALTFAVTPTFWSQAVIAEVYTLHAAFVAAVLLGLVAWAERQDRRWLYATAALYGLSLTHHRTMLLLAPAIIVFVWLTWRKRTGERRSVGAGEQGSRGAREREGDHSPHPPLSPCLLVSLSTCLLLPLLLYAYIPLRAPHAPYAQVVVGPGQTLALYEPTWRGFLQYVAGQAFEGEIGTVAQAAGRLAPAARTFVHEVTWAGVALGLIGLLWLAWRHRPLLALTGLSFLAVVGFNLFYGIGDIYVFYIPAYLVWVVWCALGVAVIGRLVIGKLVIGQMANGASRPTPHASRPRPFLVYLSPCLLVYLATSLLVRYPQIDQNRNDQARTTWQAILAQPIPQDTILISNDRDEMMPLWYVQYVEGARPDLTGLFPLIQPTEAWADVGQTVDSALRSGRPVLLTKPMPGLEVKFRLEPAGPLVRVLGPAAGEAPAHPLAITYADVIQLTGYDLHPETPAGGETMTLTLYWRPLRRLEADYTTFVHLLDADGSKIAQSDHRPGGVYYPTSLWRPGETLADAHTFTLPSDPGRPPYAIVVGLYTGTTELRHLGQPQRIRLE